MSNLIASEVTASSGKYKPAARVAKSFSEVAEIQNDFFTRSQQPKFFRSTTFTFLHQSSVLNRTKVLFQIRHANQPTEQRDKVNSFFVIVNILHNNLTLPLPERHNQ